MKYPLKQQKAHSLVLTQIIQPGTRSRETEGEGEKSLYLPPSSSSGTVRLHVSYFTPPETRCNFPSPFQQWLVNTLCGGTPESPASPEAVGSGALPAHLAAAPAGAGGSGGPKREAPDGFVLVAPVVLPSPQQLRVRGQQRLCCAGGRRQRGSAAPTQKKKKKKAQRGDI